MKYLMLFLASAPLFAASCPEPTTLLKGAEKIDICHAPTGEAVSRTCYVDPKCDWKKEVAHLRQVRPTVSELAGGKNPLSAKCALAEKSVHILRDADGNEQSFCEIAPGKYVSTAALE